MLQATRHHNDATPRGPVWVGQSDSGGSQKYRAQVFPCELPKLDSRDLKAFAPDYATNEATQQAFDYE